MPGHFHCGWLILGCQFVLSNSHIFSPFGMPLKIVPRIDLASNLPDFQQTFLIYYLSFLQND